MKRLISLIGQYLRGQTQEVKTFVIIVLFLFMKNFEFIKNKCAQSPCYKYLSFWLRQELKEC